MHTQFYSKRSDESVSVQILEVHIYVRRHQEMSVPRSCYTSMHGNKRCYRDNLLQAFYSAVVRSHKTGSARNSGVPLVQ